MKARKGLLFLVGFLGIFSFSHAQLYTGEVQVLENLAGKVGINTNTPSAALDVNGNAVVNGNFSASSLSVSGRTTSFSNTYPEYRWRFGGDEDLNWKTIAMVTIGTGIYEGVSFEVEIDNANSNHGTSVAAVTAKYYVAMRRSSGAQDNHNDAQVSGPFTNSLRVVKTSTGNYQLQVRAVESYKHMEVRYKVNSVCCGAVQVQYVDTPQNGSSSGTIYYAGAVHRHNFANVYVAGNITAASGASWPDYVFDDGYTPMSLPKLEEYIKSNKHLPEVPSEGEVKERGVDLVEMDKALLKKLEELTLHVIEQNKRIEQQQKEIDALKAKATKE